MKMRLLFAGGVGAVLSIAAVVLVASWLLPSDEIAFPDDDATPAEVVRTYVDALNARDFETSNGLWVPPETNGVFSRPGRYDEFEITGVGPDVDGNVRVAFRYVSHGGGPGEPGEGPATSAFILARTASDGPWRLIDAGEG